MLGRAERVLTPARLLLVVALAATVCLGASQLGDYRAVEIGAPQYRSVDAIAQAPELQPRSSRTAHGGWVIAIAAGAAAVLAFAVARNLRIARLLVFPGVAAVAISVLVDVPKGLDEGSVGIAYQGANAILLGPFWVQLASGITLIVIGPLLAASSSEGRARRPRRSRSRARAAESRRRRAGVADAGGTAS